MFRLLPVSRSTRAASTCTCAPPPRSRCSTAVHAYRSASKPAHAVLSNSSSTRPICPPVGRSSGAHAITPAVYLCLNSSPSATAATRNGSPRSTSTPSRGRLAESRSPSRYSAATFADPVPRARNLTCIPHPAPLPEPRPASSAISRSIASRCATTSAAAAAALYVFAHRAIWFRLLPIRATCRVRSRSISAAGTVHARVRSIARRASSDTVTPAAAAFAFHASRSAAVRRTVSHASRFMAGRPRAGSRGGAPPRAGCQGGALASAWRGWRACSRAQGCSVRTRARPRATEGGRTALSCARSASLALRAVFPAPRAASASSGLYAHVPGVLGRESGTLQGRIASFASSRPGWPVGLGEEPQQGHEGTEAGEAETDDPAQGGEFDLPSVEPSLELGLAGFKCGD